MLVLIVDGERETAHNLQERLRTWGFAVRLVDVADGRLPMKGLGALSGREAEILDLFLMGYGTATMSSQLKLSPQTVRNHLKNVCSKLNVRTQIELRELFAPLAAAAQPSARTNQSVGNL